MKTTTRFFRQIGLLAAAFVLCGTVTANAVTITIVNNDGAGEGFNDPTPVAPVGGNPGTTLGQQRLNVFQAAANVWGAILPGSVPVLVNAQFNPQTCTATSGVLGSAGPTSVYRDFAGAPIAAHWYHVALANRLNGTDLNAAAYEINATFNVSVGGATCLPSGWYLGLDGNEGAQIELLPVVIHELGHGLGFSTTTNGSSGSYLSSFPSIYDFYLYDAATGLHWDQMTATQRQTSALSLTGLSWDGPAAFTEAQSFLAKRPRMLINSPGGIAGSYAIATGTVGVPLTPAGVTGNVVLVEDAVAPTNDGCDAITNAAAIAGNIALIDRGTCTFVIKALAAQAAGATAVLIANNTTGLQPPGGSDPSITIPVVGISQADGNTIKANLGSGVNVTLGLDPVLLAGADNSNRPLVYAPNPYQSGSSVSHWDVTMTPNALMEPAINTDLHNTVDLAHGQMSDIGWFDFVVATTLARFDAQDQADGILLTWQFGAGSDVGSVTLERATSNIGPWEPTASETHMVDGAMQSLDDGVQAGVTYFYRLRVTDKNGEVTTFGGVSASHSGSLALQANVLMAPRPTPAPRGAALSFRIGQPEFVRLAIVDATGRQVRVLQNAMMAAGTHTLSWDGRSEAGEKVAPGLYFVTMRTSAGMAAKRLAVIP